MFDANGDGTVSGPEEFVFTNFVEGAETDLEGLAFFDTDGDAKLDADDASFDDFAVFQDANSNGIVDEGEFNSLSDLGIESIGLESDGVESVEADGDVLVAGTSEVTFADGTTGDAADAAFRFEEQQAETAADRPAPELELENVTLDFTKLEGEGIDSIGSVGVSNDSGKLTLDANDLLDLSGATNELPLFGDSGDTVNTSGGFTSDGNQTIDGTVFDVYTSGNAMLLAEQDVNVII